MRILFITAFIIVAMFAKEYKVGFAQDTLANDWRLAQVNEVKEEIKKYPYLKLTVKDGKTNVANQIADIEYFIKHKYDFIITSPIDRDITSLVLKKAMDKGIKVILIFQTRVFRLLTRKMGGLFVLMTVVFTFQILRTAK